MSRFKILGRGVSSRTTNESIAIACVGKSDVSGNAEASCDQLQFVYYNPETHSVQTVSSPFHAPSAPTDKLKRSNAEAYNFSKTEPKL